MHLTWRCALSLNTLAFRLACLNLLRDATFWLLVRPMVSGTQRVSRSSVAERESSASIAILSRSVSSLKTTLGFDLFMPT